MTPGGEAVEIGLAAFVEALGRRGELQSVVLEDILGHLAALEGLAGEAPPDAAKIHVELRALVDVFNGLASNAEAFPPACRSRVWPPTRSAIPSARRRKTRIGARVARASASRSGHHRPGAYGKLRLS